MVKISTNIKNFIETITKKLFYTKTEMDTKLNGKADSNHKHNDISVVMQANTLYSDLPVYYVIKNGWCIVKWENPMIYLLETGVDVPTNEWFKLGYVPIPQTGEVHQQVAFEGIDSRIRIDNSGQLLINTPDYQVEIYDILVYPTESTTNPV